jgi:invasion protein IalB
MTHIGRRTISGMLAIALAGAASMAPVPAQAQAAATAPAAPAAPTNLGTFKSWTAWQGNDAYGKICFVSADPVKSDPTTVNGKPIVRDPPHFLVIHRDKALAVNSDGSAAKDKSGNPIFRKVHDEVQAQLGYPLQPTTDSFFHTASIDSKSWNLKSIADDPSTPIKDNEAAWMSSTSDEPGFITAMKSGTNLLVAGTSARGTKTTDTYSLAGFTAAIAIIDKACP